MPRKLLTGPGPGRPKGSLNRATVEIRKLSQNLTTGNPVWVASTKARLEAGKEHPGVVQTLLYYAHGKPKETLELAPNESVSELLRLALTRRSG